MTSTPLNTRITPLPGTQSPRTPPSDSSSSLPIFDQNPTLLPVNPTIETLEPCTPTRLTFLPRTPSTQASRAPAQEAKEHSELEAYEELPIENIIAASINDLLRNFSESIKQREENLMKKMDNAMKTFEEEYK